MSHPFRPKADSGALSIKTVPTAALTPLRPTHMFRMQGRTGGDHEALSDQQGEQARRRRTQEKGRARDI